MRVRFVPGAMFRIPVGTGDSAYAVMLSAFPYVAFYDKDVALTGTGAPAGPPMFVVLVEKVAYSTGEWGPPLRVLPEADVAPIPRFFWQSPVNRADCRIVEPHRRRITVSPGDCVGLEPEAIWSAEHIESRIADAYAGRPNRFVESLRVRL